MNVNDMPDCQAVLHVCLCDVSAEDAYMVVNGMPFVGCAEHGNAAKLKALLETGLAVTLYAKNKRGDIVSVLTGEP